MTYVDDAEWPWRGKLWAHLQADTLEELHAFAASLGLQRTWFQAPPKASSPHYDVTAAKRQRALQLGALAIGRAQTVAIRKQLQAEWALLPAVRAPKQLSMF